MNYWLSLFISRALRSRGSTRPTVWMTVTMRRRLVMETFRCPHRGAERTLSCPSHLLPFSQKRRKLLLVMLNYNYYCTGCVICNLSIFYYYYITYGCKRYLIAFSLVKSLRAVCHSSVQSVWQCFVLLRMYRQCADNDGFDDMRYLYISHIEENPHTL